jgi:thiol-disulfide isomerase/thioredoxin
VTILPPVTVDGVACSAFSLAPGQGVTAEVQIEADDTPTLRRLKVVIDPKAMAAALPEGVEAPKLPDAPITVLDIQADPWDSSPSFATDEFTFAAPEGAQKVDTLTPEPPAGPDKTADEPAEPSLVGEKPAAFETKLLDETDFKLADLVGKKIIVLDFWATWCHFCVEALPIVNGVVKEFKDQDVVLYAIDKGDAPDKIKAFLKEKGWDLQVALDQDEKIAGLYKVTGIPVTFIIGRDGRIQVHHLGLLPDLKDRLTNELKRLIAGEDLTTERSAPATGGG